MGKIIGTESKTVMKNIVISVITTVAGAFAVYFLGFKDSGKKISKLEVEERTIEAWKTLVTVENIYAKNGTSLMRDAMKLGNFTEAYGETVKESQKFQNSLQGIIDTEGIDKDMKSLLERRLVNEQSQLPLARRFYSMMDSTIELAVEADWTEAQLMDTINQQINFFSKQSKGMMDRAVTDIEVLANTLSERYDHPFNMDDFLIMQIVRKNKDPYSLLEDPNSKPITPDNKISSSASTAGLLDNGSKPEDYFPGTWKTDGATIKFESNGKMNWYIASDNIDAKGTWKYADSRLQMIVTHPANGKVATWEFNLSGIDDKAFSMVLSKEPFNYYRMVRN